MPSALSLHRHHCERPCGRRCHADMAAPRRVLPAEVRPEALQFHPVPGTRASPSLTPQRREHVEHSGCNHQDRLSTAHITTRKTPKARHGTAGRTRTRQQDSPKWKPKRSCSGPIDQTHSSGANHLHTHIHTHARQASAAASLAYLAVTRQPAVAPARNEEACTCAPHDAHALLPAVRAHARMEVDSIHHEPCGTT